ncbi:MAG: hypothetical protein ACLP9L_42420 [Thermoguttaceae bacterium]
MNRCKLLVAALIGTLLMPNMTAGADTAVCPPSNAQGWDAPALPAEAKTAISPAHPAGPLTPRLQATRAGRLLILNYQLLDADRNNCLRQGLDPRPAPPWFSIRQDGREIDSGNFEYG